MEEICNGNGLIVGPAGANVFVYHIPTTMDDQGLYDLFSPFGTILSTKVVLPPQHHS